MCASYNDRPVWRKSDRDNLGPLLAAQRRSTRHAATLSGRSVFPLNGRSGYAKRTLTAQNGNMPTSAVRLVPSWGRPNVVTKRSIVLTLTSLMVLAGWPLFAH